MDVYRLAAPIGIMTYVILWLSVLSGTRVIKVGFNWHRRFGLVGVITASVHAGIILYFKYLA